MIEFLSDSQNLLPLFIAIVAANLTFIFGVFLEKFKNKRILVTYNLTNTPIGFSTTSEIWGDVKITHNDEQMNGLYLFKLTIENSSNVDYDNILVNFHCDVNSEILSHSSYNFDIQQGIVLSDNFFSGKLNNEKKYNEWLTNNPEEEMPDDISRLYDYYSTNRNFFIDVFNRKAICEFNILVGTQEDTESILYFSIPKKSMILLKQTDEAENNKIVGYWSIGIGASITLLTSLILYFSNTDLKTAIILLGIIGSLNVFVGLNLYKIVKFLRSFFR